MSVNLTKGESVDLSKKSPGLKKVFVGSGWDVSQDGKSMDLDLGVFLNTAEGRVLDKNSFIFFNNKVSPDQSAKHSGDNLTGAGDGDDEVIAIDLSSMNTSVTRIPVVIAIYNAASKNQSLGDLKNAYVRVVNQEDNSELAKFEITSGLSGDSILFGEFTKSGADWSFTAVGEVGTGEFGRFTNIYGLNAIAA